MSDDIVTVEIGGVKYTVTKEMAESLKKEEEARKKRDEEARRRQQQLETEIEQMRSRPPGNDPDSRGKPPDQGLDYRGGKPVDEDQLIETLGDEIWKDTPSALRKLVKTIKDDLRGEYNEAEKARELRQQRDEALSKFYDDFFKKHKHLNDDRKLVETTLNANMQDWMKLSREDLMEALEKEVSETILRHSKRKNNEEDEEVEEAGQEEIFEGESLTIAGKPPKKEPPKKGKESLSSIIRERRAARIK